MPSFKGTIEFDTCCHTANESSYLERVSDPGSRLTIRCSERWIPAESEGGAVYMKGIKTTTAAGCGQLIKPEGFDRKKQNSLMGLPAPLWLHFGGGHFLAFFVNT